MYKCIEFIYVYIICIYMPYILPDGMSETNWNYFRYVRVGITWWTYFFSLMFEALKVRTPRVRVMTFHGWFSCGGTDQRSTFHKQTNKHKYPYRFHVYAHTRKRTQTHTHTHTFIYIYIYIHIHLRASPGVKFKRNQNMYQGWSRNNKYQQVQVNIFWLWFWPSSWWNRKQSEDRNNVEMIETASSILEPHIQSRALRWHRSFIRWRHSLLGIDSLGFDSPWACRSEKFRRGWKKSCTSW